MATGGGAMLVLAPLAVIAAAIELVVIVAATRLVSLGSISASITVVLVTAVLYASGWVGLEVVVSAALIALVVVIAHADNIGRLLSGTERKLGEQLMAERTRPGTIATLPNLLGLGRILATPVVMALLLLPGEGTDFAAAAVFVVAALSDIADGWIARARDQVTPLGVFMDLAADKVLVAGVLVAMVEAGLVPTWIAATILIREFVVQAVRQLAAAEDVVISARALGKAKTLATNAGIALLLLAADAATGGPMAATGTGGRAPGRRAVGARGGHGAQHRLGLCLRRGRVADPRRGAAGRLIDSAYSRLTRRRTDIGCSIT